MSRRILLASTSVRRIEILSTTDLPFTSIAPDYEEDMTLHSDPVTLAKELSLGKALAVAKENPDAVVIGADTFIAYDNVLLGKPHTKERAREMLEQLSGSTHAVVTGLAVVSLAEGKTAQDVAEARVTFRVITPEEIAAYIETGEPLDRAGAYAIQGGAAKFVEHVDGDYLGILGLPREKLRAFPQNKKTPEGGFLFSFDLGALNVDRVQSFLRVLCFESDIVTLIQGSELDADERVGVKENILSTILRCDKTEKLLHLLLYDSFHTRFVIVNKLVNRPPLVPSSFRRQESSEAFAASVTRRNKTNRML